MNKHQTIKSESLITHLDVKELKLTTHRLQYNASSWGRAYIVSLTLEKISSIELHYKSLGTLIILAIAAITGGLAATGVNKQPEPVVFGLTAGLFLILLYFRTRKHLVTVTADGDIKVHFETNGMKRQQILDFIQLVEKARHEKIIIDKIVSPQ